MWWRSLLSSQDNSSRSGSLPGGKNIQVWRCKSIFISARSLIMVIFINFSNVGWDWFLLYHWSKTPDLHPSFHKWPQGWVSSTIHNTPWYTDFLHLELLGISIQSTCHLLLISDVTRTSPPHLFSSCPSLPGKFRNNQQMLEFVSL